MKAAVYYNYGPPETVKVMELEKPLPAKGQILLKVMASTVNRTDCGFRSAEYFIVRFFSGLFRPKNKVLGCEFAGIVEAVGEGVIDVKAGMRLFGFNDTTFGGHAEYMLLSEKNAFAVMPDNISFETAAALTEGAHYALCDLRAAKLKAGQRILVNGATGAIGSAAVQLALSMGAEVTAVCATENIEIVRSLKPKRIIDYRKEDFTKCGETFDIVFDAVGKSSFGKCRPIMKKKGIYMSTELGYMAENIYLAFITPLFRGKKLLFPLPVTSKSDIEFLKDLYVKGEFRPLIDKTFPLEEITEAYRYVETGMKTGNVIISVHKDNPS